MKLINLIDRKKTLSSYTLTTIQVLSILELRLQKLTAFGLAEIEDEIKKLSSMISKYKKILNSKKNFII